MIDKQQYIVVNVATWSQERLQGFLNEHGEQGYYLVHLDPVRLILQRDTPAETVDYIETVDYQVTEEEVDALTLHL